MAARRRRKKARLHGSDTETSPSAKEKPPERLQLTDVLCCVCRSVLVEPVSLPCHHRFCRSCWLSTDALRCPLCRKRVGSWLRESARRNHLVDEHLWQAIREQFPAEVANKLNGVDVNITDDSTVRLLSAPGEIRAEYEAELQRLQAERIQLEQKHYCDTESLARKLQNEEEAALKEHLEKLKLDEELARQLKATERRRTKLVPRLNGTVSVRAPANSTKRNSSRFTIERYLVNKPAEKKFTPKSKLQEEEEEAAPKEHLEKLKLDEELARQLKPTERERSKLVPCLNGTVSLRAPANGTKRNSSRSTIERYLVNKPAEKKIIPKPSPLITEDETSDSTTSSKKESVPSPRLPSSYGCFLKDYLDKKLRHLTGSMQKESASTAKKWIPPNDTSTSGAQKEFSFGGMMLGIRTKGAQKQLCPDPRATSIVQSVPVSLPYTGTLNKNVSSLVEESKREASSSDSVDSMRQELCYFKPIQATVSSSRKRSELKKALRVPAVRGIPKEPAYDPQVFPPDYLYGLQLLRGKRTLNNTPSAFVCLIKLQGETAQCDISEVKVKPKTSVYKSANKEILPYSFRRKPVVIKEAVLKSDKPHKLNSVRSTINIPKPIKDIAPNKITPRKALSSAKKRKSKINVKTVDRQMNCNRSMIQFNTVQINKVKLVAKNLSSPLEKCSAVISSQVIVCDDYGVESNNNFTMKEQTRPEAIEPTQFEYTNVDKAEQEQKDLELALRVEAEWNAGYALRRAPGKRRLAGPPHPLMIAHNKKIKLSSA